MTIILADNPVATTSSGLFPQSFSMRLNAKIRRRPGPAQGRPVVFLKESLRGRGESRGEREKKLLISPFLPFTLSPFILEVDFRD